MENCLAIYVYKQQMDLGNSLYVYQWGMENVRWIIIYFINILFSAVSVLYAIGKTDIAIYMYIGLMIIAVIFIFKTDILYKHNETKGKKVVKKKK